MSSIQEAIDSIEAAMADYLEKAEILQADLEKKSVAIAQAKTELALLAKEVEDAKASNGQDMQRLQESIEPLKTEKQRLEGEVSTLVARKGQLTTANIRLQQENAKLAAYEKKAWQMLSAKDKELQDREKAIQEKESLRPTGRTFLPPTGA